MDVVVVGGGSTGEHFVGALRRLDGDARITLVERALVGGECSYFACMPTKTMLRSPELVAAARHAPGAAEALARPLDAARIFDWRDRVASGRNDAGQVEYLRSQEAELVRGDAVVAEPGLVRVGDEELRYDRLVVATGSSPLVPPLPGLDRVDYWTNHEATETHEVPESLVVLGGGPVGCELAQFFARVGSRVTLVQRDERLLPRVDPAAGKLLADAFAEEGIELRLGAVAESVEPGIRVRLAGGRAVEGERLLVATGRRLNVEGLGLERLGVRISRRGIEVDERLRAAQDVWAIGDCTGVALFTHVGKYQARVAAADVAGRDVRADYRAIPATIFTDPQIATVGRVDGDGVVTTTWELEGTARLSTYERPRRGGFLKLAADARRRVLVGAVAAGPEAGEWLQQLTLAIRGEVPVETLLDVIQPYPTFSESVFWALRELPL